MTRLAGSKLDALDFILPDIVTGYGAGNNTITATAFAVLPTNTCTAAITNPHPTAALLCYVTYGGWLSATANGVRCCPAVSGSVTIAAGIGANGPLGWGEIPFNGTALTERWASATYSLPASATAATFSMQAMRDSAAGTQQVNFPVIRIVPLYFDL